MHLTHFSYLAHKTRADQRGATLIIVMLVLAAVTALGLASINTSTIELNLAGNDKYQKTGFYNGDAGFHGTPWLIAPAMNGDPLPAEADPNNPTGACLQYLNGKTAADFVRWITLDTVDAGACDPNQLIFKDVSYRGCQVNADIDICPTGSSPVPGGAMEFAAQTLGVGGGGGSKGTYYRIVSTGDGDRNTLYTVSGHYRWVSEAGGMR